MSTRNGRARRIREVLALFPGATVAELCEALKERQVPVWNSLDNMLEAGIVVRVANKSPQGFKLGRPLVYEPSSTPEEKAARRLARIRRGWITGAERKKARRAELQKLAQNAEAKAAKTPIAASKPAPIRHQTVEEFVAAGGRIEHIPVHWASPDLRRRAA